MEGENTNLLLSFQDTFKPKYWVRMVYIWMTFFIFSSLLATYKPAVSLYRPRGGKEYQAAFNLLSYFLQTEY